MIFRLGGLELRPSGFDPTRRFHVPSSKVTNDIAVDNERPMIGQLLV